MRPSSRKSKGAEELAKNPLGTALVDKEAMSEGTVEILYTAAYQMPICNHLVSWKHQKSSSPALKCPGSSLMDL